MTLDCRWSDPARNAAVAAKTALLDGGFLKIYAGIRAGSGITVIGAQVLLRTHNLSTPSFAAPAGGIALANAIANAVAVASGTATFAQWCNSGGTAICEGNVGTSGCDIIVATTAIVSGTTYTISSASLTDETPVTS